jgi:hypothetical protein
LPIVSEKPSRMSTGVDLLFSTLLPREGSGS